MTYISTSKKLGLARSTVMSDNKKPTHKVFVVEEREGEGKDENAFWTRVGSA